uniref:JmjC domain-containing protein n=1 Tax=Alexandrium catenella TaxID=2925 RepID=A0A7S1RHX8_ALECA
MARRMRHVVIAATAGTAASLFINNKPELSGAYLSSTCWDEGEFNELASKNATRACDLPQYHMDTWMSEHGSELPDHPAIFYRTHTQEAARWGYESFMEEFGSRTVSALPEYAQRNGHLQNPAAEGAVNASLRWLEKHWNHGKLYHSDQRCDSDSICHALAEEFGTPEVFRAARAQGTLSIGGAGSGMPFHKHGAFWQGLSLGRKAWYILPPGSMSERLHDITGPYIFPVRVFHGMLRTRPLGRRPLYCVQRPGETLYVPGSWWHASMNLDLFQVAYGGKPKDLKVQATSEQKVEMVKTFPQQAFDTAGWSAGSAGPPQSWPMPSAILARLPEVRRSCGAAVESEGNGFEEILRRMKSFGGSHLMPCLADTAAYSHCALARTLEEIYSSPECAKQIPQAALQVYKARASGWLADASVLSSELVKKERTVCKRIES